MKITYAGKEFSTFGDFWREFCRKEDSQTIREIKAFIGTRPPQATTYCEGAQIHPHIESKKERS